MKNWLVKFFRGKFFFLFIEESKLFLGNLVNIGICWLFLLIIFLIN